MAGLTEVITNTHLIVAEWRLPRNVGGILFRDQGNKEIWHCLINQNDPLTRQRFSFFHEIGHLLYDAPGGQMLFTENCTQPQTFTERRANHFAAEILMPEKLVRENWFRTKGIENIEDRILILSARFNVSKSAMKYRLQDLGIIKKI